MESLKTGYLEEKVEELYGILSERLQQNSEEINFNKFEISRGELYYKDATSKTPLTSKEELKLAESIVKILGKKRLCEMGFGIPVGPMSPWEYVVLNRLEEELPSVSDVNKADEIELQEITESAKKSTDDLIVHFEGQVPM